MMKKVKRKKLFLMEQTMKEVIKVINEYKIDQETSNATYVQNALIGGEEVGENLTYENSLGERDEKPLNGQANTVNEPVCHPL